MSRLLVHSGARTVLLLLTAVAACSYPAVTEAQVLRTTGGQTRLTVQPPAFAGVDPVPDEEVRVRLMWFRAPTMTTKIVVGTVAPGQSFRLFIEARDVLFGTAAPEAELIDGAAPRDFIRDITRRRVVGWSRVYFRAEAPAALGNSNLHGDDQHTVYFTWTAQ